jgi:hypothetical protein
MDMKNVVFWDVTPRGSCNNRCFGTAYINRVTNGELGTLSVTSNRSTRLVTTKVVPSSPIPVALMTYAIHSFETSVLTGAILRTIQEDDILHSHHRKNLNLTIIHG